MSELVGIVPAAGRGVRAYPSTATIPKAMLAVDGVPLIERNLCLLRDQLGVRRIVVVVGHHGGVLREHCSDGSRFGVTLEYVHNDRLDLELPYSVFLASQRVDGPALMLLADECYVDSDHARFAAAAPVDAEVMCGVVRVDDPTRIRENYVVEQRDGWIIGLREKPADARGPLMGAVGPEIPATS